VRRQLPAGSPGAPARRLDRVIDRVPLRAHQHGDVEAANNLGVLHYRRNNTAEAIEWFRRGAEAGDAAAAQNLRNITAT
jgi:TPR repeat protein